MENKINLKKQLPYITGFSLALIGVAFMIAELIVHLSTKKQKANLVTQVMPTREPKNVLTSVYQDANKYFVGDSVSKIDNLYGYCSKPLKQVFTQNPGILLYTFARETKSGKLKDVAIISQQYKGLDSAIVDAKAVYNDGSFKTFQQVFIKEAGIWKLGLKYGHDIQ